MKTVIDTLFLRRPKLNYVSPPVCPVVVSASSHGMSTEELFPVATPAGESFCGVLHKYLRIISTDAVLCHSVYRQTGDSFSIVYDCTPPRSAVVTTLGCYKIGAITNGVEVIGNPICVTTDVPVTIPLPAADVWNLYFNDALEVEHFSSDIFEVPVAGNYGITSITLDGESRLSDVIPYPECAGPVTPPIIPPNPVVQSPCPTYQNTGLAESPCPDTVDRNNTTSPEDGDGFSMQSGVGYMAAGFWTSIINQADADDIARAVLHKKILAVIPFADYTLAPCDSAVNVQDLGAWPTTVQTSYCPAFEIGCEKISGCNGCVSGPQSDDCPPGQQCVGCPCCNGQYAFFDSNNVTHICPCCNSTGVCQPGCYFPASDDPVDICPGSVATIVAMQNGGTGYYRMSSRTRGNINVFCPDLTTYPCAVCQAVCGDAFSRLYLGPVTLCNKSGGVYRLRVTLNVVGTLCPPGSCSSFSAFTARVNVNGPAGHVLEVGSGIADAFWQSPACVGETPYSNNFYFEFDLPEGPNSVYIRLFTNEAVGDWTIDVTPAHP